MGSGESPNVVPNHGSPTYNLVPIEGADMEMDTLHLPKKSRQPEPLGAFTKLCEPFVGKRVVVLQKSGILIFGRLDSLSPQALRLQHVTIKTKSDKIKGFELIILRCEGIEQIHEEVAGVSDSGVMSV